MLNEKVPLVVPTIAGGLEQQHKKKEGRGYLAYGVVATAFCMGFVAHSQAGIFTATQPPTVNLLRSSSTSGCQDFCESDRGTHTDSQLCGTGFMANLCGGCNFCQPKDDCQDFCKSDRGTHTDSQLCGTGFMANLCGGCNFCQPKDDCQDFCKSDRGTHTDSQLCGTGFMANLCGGCDFCQSSPKKKGSMTYWQGDDDNYSGSSCLNNPFNLKPTMKKSKHYCAVSDDIFKNGAACGDCYEVSYNGKGGSVYNGLKPKGARAGRAKIQVINSGAGGTKHFDCLDGAFNQITGLHTDGMPITYTKIACP